MYKYTCVVVCALPMEYTTIPTCNITPSLIASLFRVHADSGEKEEPWENR